MHHLALSPGFSFWVDTGPLSKRSDIAPFVGLRCDALERLVSQLMELQDDQWLGTIGGNVGYVLGKGYLAWQQPPATAEEVLLAIENALERLRPNASLESLESAWDLVGRGDPGHWYRAIALQHLLGHGREREALIVAADREICVSQDAVCDEYRGFIRRLRAL